MSLCAFKRPISMQSVEDKRLDKDYDELTRKEREIEDAWVDYHFEQVVHNPRAVWDINEAWLEFDREHNDET